MASLRIQGVCFVDFTGSLQTTACGLELGDGLADFPGPVTCFLSSVTCSACALIVREKIARQLGGESLSANTASSSARIASCDMPQPLRNTAAP